MSMIVGAIVWLFFGVPLAGLALWVLTLPFRAARGAVRKDRGQQVWDAELGQYRRPRR